MGRTDLMLTEICLLFLQGPEPGNMDPSGAGTPTNLPWYHAILGNPWIMVGLFFVIFYLLLIRPQKRQQQQVQVMQESLKKNDSVRTNAGFSCMAWTAR